MQQLLMLSVVLDDVYSAVRCHGNGGRWREFYRNLDRARSQAHANRHKLLSGEPGRR